MHFQISAVVVLFLSLCNFSARLVLFLFLSNLEGVCGINFGVGFNL